MDGKTASKQSRRHNRRVRFTKINAILIAGLTFETPKQAAFAFSALLSRLEYFAECNTAPVKVTTLHSMAR